MIAPAASIFRERFAPLELRASSTGSTVMSGYITRWSDATTIANPRERGYPFVERFSPSSFDRTIVEDGSQLVTQYHHGRDSAVGTLPLGRVTQFRADSVGVYYELELLADAPNVRAILPAARAGLLGSSFAFSVQREQERMRPPPSEQNPKGLPEILYEQVRVRELGPTPMPANKNSTAIIGATATSEGNRSWML